MKVENKEGKERKLGGRPETSGLFIQRGGKTYDLDEFYKQFMEIADPTCYLFALEVFTEVPRYERWDEFNRICENPWFRGYIQRWLEELEIKMRAQALKNIKNGCDAKDFPRFRWLAEGKAFNPNPPKKPTKAQKEKEQRIQNSLRSTNPDAYEIVKGG